MSRYPGCIPERYKIAPAAAAQQWSQHGARSGPREQGVAVVVVQGKRASYEGWVGIFTRGSERGRDRHVRVGAPGARAALARGENAAQGQCRLHAAPGKPVMTQAD